MPTSSMPRIIILTLFVSSRLQFEVFNGFVSAENRNIRVSEFTVVAIFCHSVSGSHIITISKSFGHSKKPISPHSGDPEAPKFGRTRKLKIAPLESP